jgi:hypothetical protein
MREAIASHQGAGCPEFDGPKYRHFTAPQKEIPIQERDHGMVGWRKSARSL